MENEQLFEQMVQLLGQIVTTAGADWTMEFLQGGLEMVQQGGGEPEPEVMSQGGPKSMASPSGLGASGRPMPPMRN